MSVRLVALCVAARDPERLARFWAVLLGWEPPGRADADGGATLRPSDDTGFDLRFLPTDDPKTQPNQAHVDLTSTSLEDQRRTVERALALGAHHLDVGQRPEEGHVVLADPEGNELCVIEPGNRFLADCGRVGALACGPKLTWGGPPVRPKAATNRLHLDLAPVADDDLEAEVERLVALGASRTRSGHHPSDGVAMADPDGNELCVLPAA